MGRVDRAIRTPKQAPSNVDLVAGAMREAIANGRLVPGDRVKEVPIADQLGMSRGPVREAIRLLEHDGLLQVLPNRGAVVPDVHPNDVYEVYALRSALGGLALEAVTGVDGRVKAGCLERPLARLRRAVAEDDGTRAADADLEYQAALVRMAEMPRVTRQFDQLTWQVRIFIATLHSVYDEKLDEMLTEVEALHNAVITRDKALARRLWQAKFEHWIGDFISKIASRSTEQR